MLEWIKDLNGFAEFDTHVLQASHMQPVLVDFWADWCAPCLFLAPVLADVVKGYDGRIHLAKLDTEEDENLKLAGRFQVRGFPTVVLIQNGTEVARFTSSRTHAFVREFIDSHVSI